jgi:D-3-phosphoglycerate dehydrogenase / 2-oxoglutarate reductase
LRPGPSATDLAALGADAMELDALVATADVLCLCCPLTETTRKLMSARRFAAMKPGAFFVNAARGELVDEVALVEALRTGRLSGAGIDVFAREPPGQDHPLLALGNVILGSHNLAFTDETIRLGNAAAADAVLALADGRRPDHIAGSRAFDHALWGGASAG